MTESDPIGDYCDYLDKEMTIMGLLTAFSVAVPAVVLDRLAGAKQPDQQVLATLWHTEQTALAAGSLAFFLAALAFYLQRSHLAFYYGQLRLSLTAVRYKGITSKSLLEEADSWSTWVRYNSAFALLIVGFALYGAALFAPDFVALHPAPTIACSATPALLYVVLNWRVKTVCEYSDHPWIRYFTGKEPHEGAETQ